MNVKDCVVLRFQQLCNERNIKFNELAVCAGITPSTVYSMLDSQRRNLSVATVKKLCDGMDITLGTFFSAPEFDSLVHETE